MRSFGWQNSLWGPGDATETYWGYVVAQLNPGDTITRSLLWLKFQVQTMTQPDPMWGFGPLSACGLMIGSSGSVPPLNPLTDWTHSGDPNWMWQWWPPGGDSFSPAGLITNGWVNDLMGGRYEHDVHSQHVNVSGELEYLWLTAAVDETAFGAGPNSFSAAAKILVLEAGS